MGLLSLWLGREHVQVLQPSDEKESGHTVLSPVLPGVPTGHGTAGCTCIGRLYSGSETGPGPGV